MGLNAPTGQMDQQPRKKHLCGRDRVAGEGRSGPGKGEKNGEARNRAAEKNGSPNVEMNRTAVPSPGSWRNNHGYDNSSQPLKQHQSREPTVGPLEDGLPMP